MSYLGYGIDCSKDSYRYRPDAMKELWERAKNIDWVKEGYAEYCGSNELDPDDEETYTEYMESYEDALQRTYNAGTEGFIADVINTLSGTAGNPFRYRDSCIFVEATLPEDDDDRNVIPTKKRIREIFEEFVGPLVYHNSARPAWIQIND